MRVGLAAARLAAQATEAVRKRLKYSARMASWSVRGVSPGEAVGRIESGMRVFVHGAAATPQPLVEALSARRDLSGVSLYHLHTTGRAPFADPENDGRFLSVSLFAGPPVRATIADGRADFVPVFLSGIPRLFSDGGHPDPRRAGSAGPTAARPGGHRHRGDSTLRTERGGTGRGRK